MYPFKEGSYAPRNGWYVAGFREEIGEALLSRWILNEPVVLYRKQDGTAVAVEGRCPHRHFPLGASKRVGDAIQCGYHGITFDSAGKCTLVPSQEKIPGVYSIKAYPLVEHGLWAWIWPGDPALADPALLPSLEEIGLSIKDMVARPFYAEYVEGRYQLLNDNLLDLSHLGYLHGTSIGTADNASTPEERDVSDRRVSSRRIMRDAPIPPVGEGRLNFDGLVDRVSGMDFFFPGFHAGIGETYIPQSHAERGGEILQASRVWHAVTPANKYSTHYFFALGSTNAKDVDDMYDYLKPVVAEDVFATVEIEKIIQTMDDLPGELMLKSDGTAVLGRRKLQEMMDQEAATAA